MFISNYHYSPIAVEFMECLLAFDPNVRLSASEALNHSFFRSGGYEKLEPIVTESSGGTEELNSFTNNLDKDSSTSCTSLFLFNCHLLV